MAISIHLLCVFLFVCCSYILPCETPTDQFIFFEIPSLDLDSPLGWNMVFPEYGILYIGLCHYCKTHFDSYALFLIVKLYILSNYVRYDKIDISKNIH
jgi:hypothetical protein